MECLSYGDKKCGKYLFQDSMAAAARGDNPVLEIGDLAGTLESAELLAAFRKFLRALDGKANAAPEIKGLPVSSTCYSNKYQKYVLTGRFERYLDFTMSMNAAYALPEEDVASVSAKLESIRQDFFACPPSQKLSVVSQVALKRMADHLKTLSEQKSANPDLQLTRPVYEDVFRKLQQKHDVWKKNYKPTLSLQALLCLLS